MAGNFVSEVGFAVQGAEMHLGFDVNGRPMMSLKVDRNVNSADVTMAPLDDEAIIRILAYANRALVGRLDVEKSRNAPSQENRKEEGSQVLPFNPKGG